MLRESGTTGEWREYAAKVAKAVKGSSIAVIIGPVRYRVYYQDPELCLRENYHDSTSTTTRQLRIARANQVRALRAVDQA